MKTIAITGASGLLGPWLTESILLAGHQAVPIIRNPAISFPVPVIHLTESDPSTIFSFLDKVNPDVVIHAAALSSSAACEADPLTANQSNVTLTGIWSDCCAHAGIPFAFLSTDLVYRGDNGSYTETDPSHPLHVYGDTKIRAERYLAESNHQSWIFRLSLLIGHSLSGTNGFMDQFLSRIKQGENFTAFSDEFRSALTTKTAAEIITRSVLQPIPFGIYNLGGTERESRFTIAHKILSDLNLPDQMLHEGSVHNFKGIPVRQPDVTMRTDKICKALNILRIPGLEAIPLTKPLILP